MNGTVLFTENLAIGYAPRGRPRRALADQLSVTLHAGELVCLIGPNGAGKSTLLRTLAGMQTPLDGRALLMGDDVHRLSAIELAKRLSVVLTERVDVGILSACALVALGRYPYTGWSGNLTAHDQAVIRWAIQAVGAAELAPRSIHELSDGERQKVMIARALAQEPGVMILDEPTAFLDLPHRVEIMQVLRCLAHDTGRAILLSTHDLDLALRSADRIWLLASGRLQAGAPEDLVLSDAFEAAFQRGGVRFDKRSGSFSVNGQSAGRVALHGDGVELIWTQRALERAGFAVVEDGDAPCIVVSPNGSGTTWHVQMNGVTVSHTSIYELLAFLTNGR